MKKNMLSLVRTRLVVITISLLFVVFAVYLSPAMAQQPDGSRAEVSLLLSRGDLKGAIAILDKNIAKKLDPLESLKTRSTLRAMSGDLTGSLNDLSAAIEIKHDDPDLYSRRATARMNLGGDTKLVLADLDLAIAYGKKLDSTYSLRANLRRMSGDTTGAIEDYLSAIALRPENVGANVGLASIYLFMGENDKAIKLLENFLASYENLETDIGKSLDTAVLGSKPVVASIVPLGTDAKTASQNMETVVLKRPAGQTAPRSRDEIDKTNQGSEDTKNTGLAYSTLAAAYAKKSEYEKALATIEKSIKFDDSDFYAFEVRGTIRVGMGNFQDAIGDLTVSINSFPANPPVYIDRGIAYLMTGKSAEAEKDFAKYLELYPKGKDNLARRIDEAKAKYPR
jgi:tetratricopeptide (TPR) repeat protein